MDSKFLIPGEANPENENLFFKFIIEKSISSFSESKKINSIDIFYITDQSEERSFRIKKEQDKLIIVDNKLRIDHQFYDYNNKFILYPINNYQNALVSDHFETQEFLRSLIKSRMDMFRTVLLPICNILSPIKNKLILPIKFQKYNQSLYAKYDNITVCFAKDSDTYIEGISTAVEVIYFPIGLRIEVLTGVPIYYKCYNNHIFTERKSIPVAIERYSYKLLTSSTYDGEKYYKVYAGAEPGGSARLNTSIIEYLMTGIPIDDEKNKQLDVKKRILNLLDGYDDNIKLDNRIRCSVCDLDQIVYHGTSSPIHKSTKCTLLAFLSTTVSWNIAAKYATNGGSIYIIKIKAGYPFLHLNDRKNLQILLPIGMEVTVHKSEKISDYMIHSSTIEGNFTTQHLNNYRIIFNQITTFPKLKIETKKYIDNISNFSNIETLKLNSGSSVFFTGMHQNQKYYIKSITKSNNIRRHDRGKFFIIKRIVNEILASIVYNFYGLKTLEYKIIVNDLHIKNMDYFSLSSPEINNINYNFTNNFEMSRDVMRGFLVDCILSNWDVGNNNNIGYRDNQSIRTDVGGALVYRGRGDIKIEYYNKAPDEDKIFMNNNIGTGRFFNLCRSQCKDENINIKNLIQLIIRKTDIKKLKTYPPLLELKNNLSDIGLNIMSNFIDQVVDIVIIRHNFYNKSAQKSYVLFENNKKYIVNKDKSGEYITVLKKKYYLSEIPGKYSTIMNGGSQKQDSSTGTVSPEIFQYIIANRLNEISDKLK